MNTKTMRGLLLASTLLVMPATAFAQPATPAGEAEPPADAPSPDSLLTVSDAEANATATDSKMSLLEAQISALQAQLDEVKKTQAKNAPVWKGAPEFADKDAGWSFKPKGVIQFDAGYVSLPSGYDTGLATGALTAGAAQPLGTVAPLSTAYGTGSVATNNLGWGARARRLIIGAEGSVPLGFGYKFELELSQGGVQYEDMVITWQKGTSPLLFTVGYHYPLQSLEQLTSNRFTSFTERAGMVDAFGYGRRLGGSITYTPKNRPLYLAAGLWGRDIATPAVQAGGSGPANGNQFGDNSWQASARFVYAPWVGPVQTHFGLNFQHRVNSSDTQSSRYRMRPFTQITDQRFVDTGRIAAAGDDILGVELAGIWKSIHFAGEYQHVWVRSFADVTRNFGANNGVNGAGSANTAALFAQSSPEFSSWYAEVGYFLTGETRGYKGFKWDRTKVLHPITDGGLGAWQINARVDQTDLNDTVGAGAVTSATAYANSTNYINGGKQTGYEASLIWLPMDFVKFALQYAHSDVKGGPYTISKLTDLTNTSLSQSFSVDAVTLRAQLDF